MRRRLFVATLVATSLAGPVLAAPPGAVPEAAHLVRPGDPILGNPEGDLTLVDFYDLRCGPCRAMEPRLRRLLAVDHGIRYVPIDDPILGPASQLGVAALFAAQAQGAYAALRARLLTQARPPSLDVIRADALALGLDWPQLEMTMSGDAVAHRISTNLARGRALGIRRVPTLVIGSILVPGALDEADLVSLVGSARRRADRRAAAGGPAADRAGLSWHRA
ncbi:MAG: thioredoxin domain-containing protein [Proteobacteria bacterium]|nr:thioredoxin domain-containing protein [Pseudomonadota bacterium]